MSDFQAVLDARIRSSAAGDVVMRSTRRNSNHLTVSVVNAGDRDLMLLAGGPAAAAIRIDFGGMLNPAELGQVNVVARGWTAQLDSTGAPAAWMLKPAADTRLARGRALTFALTLGGVSGKRGTYKVADMATNLADAANSQQLCPRATASAGLILADNLDLAFDIHIDSATDDHIVVRSAGANHNLLTAHIVNAGDRTVCLAAGGAAPAEIVFDFGTLLSSSAAGGEVDQAVIASPGWTAALDKSTPPYVWVLRPASDQQVAPSAELSFTITFGAVGMASEVGTHEIAVTCRHVADAADPWVLCPDMMVGASVILANGPSAAGKSLKGLLVADADPGSILCWTRTADPVINEPLVLTIANSDRDNGLLATVPRTCEPTLTIVFPTVPRPAATASARERQGERKALTYVDLAKGIAIDIAPDGTEDDLHPWSKVVPNESYLTWRVTPARGNDEVLGPGGALMLHIGNIISPLPEFATRIYVLYSGFGDYDDGYIPVLLTKREPKPTITHFGPVDASVDYGRPHRLTWKTVGADWIRIAHLHDNKPVTWSSRAEGQEVGLHFPDGDIAIPVEKDAILEKTTTFSLSLMRDQVEVDRRDVDVVVNRPELEYFEVVPDQIAKGGSAKLRWKISGPWPLTGLLRDDRQTVTRTIGPATEGELDVRADATTTYTLDVTAATPRPLALRPIPTAVLNVCRPTRTLTASPTGLLAPGTPVTLTWQTTFATARSLTTPGEKPDCLNGIAATGSVVVRPRHTTTYTLHVEGFDAPEGLPLQVDVKAVDILDFTMSRRAGPGLQLEWMGERVSFHISARYARSLRIEQAGMVLWPFPGETPDYKPDDLASFDIADVQLFNGGPVTLFAEGPGDAMRRDLPVSMKSGLTIDQFTMKTDGSGIQFSWSARSRKAHLRGEIGSVMREHFPTRDNIDGDEHSLQERMSSKEIFSELGGGSPENPRGTSSSGTWQWRGDTSAEFLGEHDFYLLVWEEGQRVPMIRRAARE